ncbi:MAG TPA: thioredoxin family protein [Pirellulales bacterium]|nr:thioredoxin family protein [Pirellulales bacterium]
MFKNHMVLRLGLAAVALVAASAAWGQSPRPGDLLGGSGISFGGGDEGELDVSASITKAARGEPARLVITAEIPDGWHTFSITQQPGGPLKTKIKLDPSKEFKLAGDFKADPAPKVSKSAAYGDLPIETHEGRVTWSAPIELSAGVDPSALKITGAISSQRCFGEDKCLPPKSFKFTAAVEESTKKEQVPPGGAPLSEKSSLPPGAVSGPFTPAGTHVTLRSWIEPAVVAPSGVAKLIISAEPTDGYHVYAYADRDPKAVGIGKPTLIALTDTSGFRYVPPEASAKPLEKPAEGVAGTIRYHESPVRWTMPIEIPAATKPGDYPIRGLIGIHTCNDAIGCDLPQAAEFRTSIVVGAAVARGAGQEALFTPLAYSRAAAIAEQNAGGPKPDGAVAAVNRDSVSSTAAVAASRPRPEPLQLSAVILFSLLGGFILNFMPCVLPVVGLKVLSFVEQGGKSRAHVLGLNLCYTLGLMAVFMVLAGLNASAAHLAWGERSTGFNIGLTCVVFVMALSFLGVWEIPIPGFVGTGKGVELAAREGAAGAFAKGVLTTILATPCSGPFLGAVFAFGATQRPQTVFLIYGMIGLGMALPYIVIGAFPRLVRFLPKPGAWMDTFKQFMGFVLLGTVVYLFWTLNRTYLVPTFALMIGLWFACWWIGRTPLMASLSRKLAAWAFGCVAAAAIGVFAFFFLTPAALDGEPFSQARLETLAASGKTVLVDFTASWCPTCQVNGRFVIDSEAVREAIKAKDAVLMIADWSDYGPEIKSALWNLTASESIPVLVIFPAGRSHDPIILRDLLTTRQVIEALDQAGPSRRQGETVQQPKAENANGVAALQ